MIFDILLITLSAAALLLGIYSFYWSEPFCGTISFGLAGFLFFLFYSLKKDEKIKKDLEEANNIELKKSENEFRILQANYNELSNKLDIPLKYEDVFYKKASNNSHIQLSQKSATFMVWKSNNKINFFPSQHSIKDCIKLEEIKINSLPLMTPLKKRPDNISPNYTLAKMRDLYYNIDNKPTSP